MSKTKSQKEEKAGAGAISAKAVAELRAKTNAPMMKCKEALKESAGDVTKAVEWLRKKGEATAAKKAGRDAKEGVIASYIHFDKVGVLIEINCETDFVAKNESFRNFVKDVTMQIAAATPLYLSREEVPQEYIDKEKEVAAAQIKDKPPEIVDKIVSGKIDKQISQIVLLEQAFVKDQNQTIGDLLKAKIAELGENIVIRRFTRYAVGEE